MYVLEKKRCESFAVGPAGGDQSEKNMAEQSSQVMGDLLTNFHIASAACERIVPP